MPVNTPRALVPAPSSVPPNHSINAPRPPLTSIGAMDDRCSANVDFSDYSIPLLTICLAALIIGLIFCFFGYRLLKATLFLVGLLFGVVVAFVVCERQRVFVEQQQLGSAAVQVLVAQTTLVIPRAFTVVCTSTVGAALIVIPLDYVVHRFAVVEWLWTDVLGAGGQTTSSPLYDHLRHMCWYGWALAGLWPALSGVGVVVQLRCTALGFSHKQDTRSHKKYAARPRHASSQRLNEVGVPDVVQSSSLSNNRQSSCSSSAIDRISAVVSSSTAKENRLDKRKLESKLKKPPKQNASVMDAYHKHQSTHVKRSFVSLYRQRNKGDIICQSHMESLQRGTIAIGPEGQTTLSSVNSTQLTAVDDTPPPSTVVGIVA